MDRSGNIVIQPQFDDAGCFIEDRARVVISDKVGYIDRNGKLVVGAKYTNGTYYNEGCAFVVAENSYPICIDKDGKTLFELNMNVNVSVFHEGLAIYYDREKDACGYINKKGLIEIPAIYKNAWFFTEGLACVSLDGEKYGYINRNGNLVINYQYVLDDYGEECGDFHEGLAFVSLDGKRYGYINKDGALVINYIFKHSDNAFSLFNEGLSAVRFDGGKSGYINRSGKLVINPQFSFAYYFTEGLAVIEGDNNIYGFSKYGYINKKGKIVISPQFDEAFPFCDGYAVVRMGSKYGIIDKDGKFLCNPQFDEIKPNINNDLRYLLDMDECAVRTNPSSNSSPITFNVDNLIDALFEAKDDSFGGAPLGKLIKGWDLGVCRKIRDSIFVNGVVFPYSIYINLDQQGKVSYEDFVLHLKLDCDTKVIIDEIEKAISNKIGELAGIPLNKQEYGWYVGWSHHTSQGYVVRGTWVLIIPNMDKYLNFVNKRQIDSTAIGDESDLISVW